MNAKVPHGLPKIVQLTGKIGITCNLRFTKKMLLQVILGRKITIDLTIDTENEAGTCRVNEPVISVEPILSSSRLGFRRTLQE